MKTNRTLMSPAASAAGFSAFSCLKCKVHFTKEQEKTLISNYCVTCDCGTLNREADVRISILPRYADFLRKPWLTEQMWYHATDKEDWFTDINSHDDSPLVHVGALESALERSNHLDGLNWMHCVSIKPDARISPYVIEDQNYWPTWNYELNEIIEFSQFDEVTRYVNRFEIPGSISLLVNASALVWHGAERNTLLDIPKQTW